MQGVSLAGLALGLPLPSRAGGGQRVLEGTEFDLTIGEAPVNFTGRPRTVLTVNGQLPAPLLRWREGDTVTLRVRNRLAGRVPSTGTAFCCPPTWTACRA